MKTVSTTLLLVLLALLPVGCGGDSEDQVRDELADRMVESSQGMLSQSEAECSADVLIDVLGEERARNYLDAMMGDIEAATRMERISMEEQEALMERMSACEDS
jgi:hypothetical protein